MRDWTWLTMPGYDALNDLFNALLAVIPFTEKRKLPALIEDYQSSPTLAISLILHARPVPCPFKPNALQTPAQEIQCAGLIPALPFQYRLARI